MSRSSLIFILILAWAMPLGAADGKKKPGRKKDVPTPTLDADNLKPGVFRGTLVRPPGTDGQFTIDVEYQYLEPKKNGGAGKENDLAKKLVREQHQLQQETNKARADLIAGRDAIGHLLRIQNLQIRMQQQIAQARAQGVDLAKNFDVKTGKQRVEFHAAPDVKVRLNAPAESFTEKGDIKKFTAAELKEMKGKNPNLPGFEGHPADLKTGQIVQVYQSRPKPLPKNPDADTLEEQKTYKNMVLIILVLGEGPVPNETGSPSVKKGK